MTLDLANCLSAERLRPLLLAATAAAAGTDANDVAAVEDSSALSAVCGAPLALSVWLLVAPRLCAGALAAALAMISCTSRADGPGSTCSTTSDAI